MQQRLLILVFKSSEKGAGSSVDIYNKHLAVSEDNLTTAKVCPLGSAVLASRAFRVGRSGYIPIFSTQNSSTTNPQTSYVDHAPIASVRDLCVVLEHLPLYHIAWAFSALCVRRTFGDILCKLFTSTTVQSLDPRYHRDIRLCQGLIHLAALHWMRPPRTNMQCRKDLMRCKPCCTALTIVNFIPQV